MRLIHTDELRSALAEYTLPALPRSLRERLAGEQSSWNYADLSPVAKPGDGEVRLLIAPTNSASQAVGWCRAAETIPGVSARSLAFSADQIPVTDGPDVSVKHKVGTRSRVWARRQRKQILSGFTHVLYEAERPILSPLYGGDLVAEIEDLQSHGIQVATLSHGSDVRTPSQHAALVDDSPFASDLDGLTETLEQSTRRNRGWLAKLSGPQFVSTLDQLRYLPEAQWLPTVVDPAAWTNLEPAELRGHKLRVLHVPSNSALKGTGYIRESMRALHERGVIEYVEATAVPHADMPKWVAESDVVIDQLTMELYGVASVEAMLAGRLVVAQVGAFLRERTLERTGWDVPIVEANPATISSVIEGIAADPQRYRQLPLEGRAFALEVHSSSQAADALRGFLGGDS